MTFGIIGVGHLSASLLLGFLRAGLAPETIVLSPRGQARALSERHGFGLAADNAALVDACDIVLLAVRPSDAERAIEGLPWRSGQILLSACAGVPIASLAQAVHPAEVVRIMPITAASLGCSPTPVYPLRSAIVPYLEALGSPVPLESEEQFEAATVSAAIYGWAQALIRAGAEWSGAHGLAQETARQLVARTFVASGRMLAESDAPMSDILESLCTPGGITEAGLRHLEKARAVDAWHHACDLVLRKLRE